MKQKRKVKVEVSWIEIHEKVIEIDVEGEYDKDIDEFWYDESEVVETAKELATWNQQDSCQHTEYQDEKIIK